MGRSNSVAGQRRAYQSATKKQLRWAYADSLRRLYTVPIPLVPFFEPAGPRLSGGTLVDEVTNGANVVLVMPPVHSLDGTVVIHSSRNSSAGTATISDTSGATWTVRDGPTSANSASAHYVWSAPWREAMQGATVTIVWTNGQNSGATAEVWEGYFWDAITVATTNGDSTPPFTETAPAHTAGGTEWAALAMGGGRGVNDDSQPSLDTTVVPSGWSNLQEANSTQATGTARNAWAWSASKIVTGSASMSAEVFTDTLETNSRYAATVSLRRTTPVVRSRGSKAAALGGASITFSQTDFDVAPQTGDILVAQLSSWDGSSSGTETPETPSGWTPIGGSIGGSAGDFDAGSTTLFWKPWSSGDTTYSFTTLGSHLIATVVAIAGADTSTPVDASATATASLAATINAASVSPAGAADLLLVAVAEWSATSTMTVPGSMTSQGQIASTSGGNSTQILASESLVASGATGTRAFGVNSADYAAAITVAIKAPSAGGATVNAVAAPMTLGSTTAHTIRGGSRVDAVAAAMTLGSTTAHSAIGGAVVSAQVATIVTGKITTPFGVPTTAWDKAGGTTLAAAALTVEAGDVIVIGATWDNLTATTPTATGSHTGTATIVWSTETSADSDNPTASSGVRSSLILGKVTEAGTCTATVTLSASVAAKMLTQQVYRGCDRTTPWRAAATASAFDNSTTPSVTSAGALSVGDVAVGYWGIEGNSTVGADDTDTVNGSWSASTTDVTSPGLNNTNIREGYQDKTVTGVGTQTFNVDINGTVRWGAHIIALIPGSTSHTITGAAGGSATVNAAAATVTLGATAPTIQGGAVVNATAGPETLNSGTHTITGGIVTLDGTVNAVAASMTLDTINVAIDAVYYAYVAEMSLGTTTDHTILGWSPDGTVNAVRAQMSFDWTFPTVIGGDPVPILVRLSSTSVGNFHEAKVPRPAASNEWVGLWPRLVFPAVQKALLLWEDGRVLEVTSLQGDYVDTADEIIAGGTVWEGLSNSWQAEALAAAGYTLVPVEGA